MNLIGEKEVLVVLGLIKGILIKNKGLIKKQKHENNSANGWERF